MREHGKAWALYVFSSANALRQYTDEELVGLGVSWVWLGPRGRGERLRQAQGHRHARAGAASCRRTASGCSARASSGCRSTTPDNIDRAIDHAVAPRHRVPPVHALHAGAGHAAPRRAPGERHAALHRGVPRRRHPRAAPLQLPPPAHRERRGDGVPAAGLPARLRGERAERHPHRADAAARLARPQGPPRPARARPRRLRDEGPRDPVRGSAVGLREVVRAQRTRRSRRACGPRGAGSSGSSDGRRDSPPASSARSCSRRSWREERRLRRGRTYEPPTFYEANPAAAARPEIAARGAAGCRFVEPPARAAETSEAVA